jgi:hypothetical protein
VALLWEIFKTTRKKKIRVKKNIRVTLTIIFGLELENTRGMVTDYWSKFSIEVCG